MNGLTSGKLADILEGHLELGTMPPIGGDLEPVRGVVFESSAVEKGDVYWDIACCGTATNTGVPEEAFARGSAGVVSCRYIEPWAGAFSIQVGDPHHALERLAHWVMIRSKRRRILVLDAPEARLSALLRQLISGQQSSLPRHCADDVAMQTIRGGLAAGWDLVCVPATTEENLGRISDLCAPRVAVITSAAVGRMDLPALVEALPKRGVAVLSTDDSHVPSFQTTATSVIHVGNASGAEPEEWKLARIVGKQLGFREQRIADAYKKLCEQYTNESITETSKVPPLVSGLRESDAALPPGLKRWAC